MTTTQKVVVSIPSKKASYELELNLSEASKFAGEVVNFPTSQEFTFNGLLIKVPGETASTDKVMRSFAVLMAMTSAMFTGLESEAVQPEDSMQAIFCDGLRAKGFAIPFTSRASACEAIRIWKDAKKHTVKAHEIATREANVKKWVEIKQAKQYNKVLEASLKGKVNTLLEAAK